MMRDRHVTALLCNAPSAFILPPAPLTKNPANLRSLGPPCIVIFLISVFACWVNADAADHDKKANADLHMSADLQKLFQQEMLALLTGAQAIAAYLPVANWEGIAETSAMMRHSYVLEKKLTRAQEDELSRLPGEFKSLDEAFHLRAERLERAAVTRDAEAVAFQFSRLLESCTECHARFAQAKFPAFGSTYRHDHH